MSNTKRISVERVTMGTPYGDIFTATSHYINWRGELIEMWSTTKGNALPEAPSALAAKGYKIIERHTVEKTYKQSESGAWECDS